MRDFRDAKAMAQTLREALKSKSVTLTHSESLELIARSFGLSRRARLASLELLSFNRAMTAFASSR